MPDVTRALRLLATSWRGDALLAALVVTWSIIWVSLIAAPGDRPWTVLVFALVCAAAVGVRRRWPITAATIASGAMLAVQPLGLDQTTAGALSVLFPWTAFLIAYTLGTATGVPTGLACSILLAGAVQFSSPGGFNPLSVMMTIGPWLAGRAMVSRRRMAERLEARNQELQAEQESFARESVQYERARIARELHDIVAHCLSVMVVQASAGQRVADVNPDGVAEALQSVAEAATEAQTEIGRLVALLSGDSPSGDSPGLQMVDELVRHAAAVGLVVTCRFLGSYDRLTPAASEAAYRVAQEALTNALKHAPGASVDITIRGQDSAVEVTIVNGAPLHKFSGLERSGGGYGLAGMRTRVSACAGVLTYGPTATGGWRVSALLSGAGSTSGVGRTATRS